MSGRPQEHEVDVHKQLAIFSNYLRRKGLKITNQRQLVAEQVFGMNTHFTVDSLAEDLRSKHKKRISRATIYRIVSVLVEAGLLTEHNFGQNARHYEHIPRADHHDHILCVDCGRIDEFVSEEIERLQVQIANERGFDLDEHALNLYGKCKELRETGDCPHKTS